MSASMDTLRSRLEGLEEEFSILDSWSLKFQVLLEIKQSQASLESSECNEASLVPGCSSPLWLKAGMEDGLRRVRARCDSGIPSGLAGLCVHLLDQTLPCPPGPGPADPDPVEIIRRLSLDSSLSPTRLATLGRMLARGLGAS